MQQIRVKAAQDKVVAKDELVKEVERLAAEGARFTTMVCLDRHPEFEIIYMFQGADLSLIRFRVHIAKDEEIPSISGVLLAAVLMENEIKEFFGVRFTNLALDFKCRMLLAADSPQTPLLKVKPDSRLEGGA